MEKNKKNYVRKTFVLDKEVVRKLEIMAKKQDRKLNWLVKTILANWCDKN